MKLARAAAALALAAPAVAAEEETGDPAFGLWLIQSGRAIVRIEACGEAACGAIAWLDRPRDDEGAPLRDVNNPDEALRDRPVCGMVFMTGFDRAAPGEWKDGEIYNSHDGRTYSGEFALDEDGRLAMRGYIGLRAFGRTQTWTRTRNDRGGCEG